MSTDRDQEELDQTPSSLIEALQATIQPPNSRKAVIPGARAQTSKKRSVARTKTNGDPYERFGFLGIVLGIVIVLFFIIILLFLLLLVAIPLLHSINP